MYMYVNYTTVYVTSIKTTACSAYLPLQSHQFQVTINWIQKVDTTLYVYREQILP